MEVSQLHSPAALLPNRAPPVPITLKAGLGTDPYWAFLRGENSLVRAGNRSMIPRLSSPQTVITPTELSGLL